MLLKHYTFLWLGPILSLGQLSILHYFSHINIIENVQYTFLKLVCFKLNSHISRGSYNVQITQLRITSCNLKRNAVDIISYVLCIMY